MTEADLNRIETSLGITHPARYREFALRLPESPDGDDDYTLDAPAPRSPGIYPPSFAGWKLGGIARQDCLRAAYGTQPPDTGIGLDAR